MGARFATSDEVKKLMEFSQKPYRPREYVEQQERIELATRALEAKERAGTLGPEDAIVIQSIVDMKLELDAIVLRWTNGKIEDKPYIRLTA